MSTWVEQIREVVREPGVSSDAISEETESLDDLSRVSAWRAGPDSSFTRKNHRRASALTHLSSFSDCGTGPIAVRIQAMRSKRMSMQSEESAFDELYWTTVAVEYAKDASKNLFHSRRGEFCITNVPTVSGQAVCIYDNNPYTDFINGRSAWRDEETESLVAKLEERGFRQLSYAVWPAKRGPGYGYTYAMIVDASEEQMDEIKSIAVENLSQSFSIRRSLQIETE